MTHGLTFDETGPTWFALPAQLERERHANGKLTAELAEVRAENHYLRHELVTMTNGIADGLEDFVGQIVARSVHRLKHLKNDFGGAA
jgi:hypothetical protein